MSRVADAMLRLVGRAAEEVEYARVRIWFEGAGWRQWRRDCPEFSVEGLRQDWISKAQHERAYVGFSDREIRRRMSRLP